VDYENANKALDKARAKNKDVLQAETSQQLCCQKFEKISESAKQGTVASLTCHDKGYYWLLWLLCKLFTSNSFVHRTYRF
jgi:hypothetical protein